MGKVEVKVVFETITPLWTGDAWQENSEIRPSSLMGSLRFWFAFYWKVVKGGITEKLDEKGVPVENLQKLEDEKKEDFKILLIKHLQENDNFDKAIDKALDDLGLSVSSRIFGCTGWKSRVRLYIEDFFEMNLEKKNIEFYFPENVNSKFWISKILFDGQNEIKMFKDVSVTLKTSRYWWDEYLKDFFEYFKDKMILVGGKNSFGFGFVNLIVNTFPESGTSLPISSNLKIEKIEKITYSKSKEVVGFNFKYYLRKKEEKRFRKNNFGEQGKASKVYVSHLLKKDNNSVYLLLLNSPFDDRKIPLSVFQKYTTWLNRLNKGDESE